ncbi:Protein of unknown function [Filimonas lacunae]|uniref:DUF3606 domain-containing protein n=1 Tax=Filimonas lacunae TaxID=477680 RepID=A0A173M9S7_9BACT|nr:DUF3606 domain-containing protein [Filimonas lacunae]BAV04228.1 hypothetical protein FLA_0207 [Filimonas lacunae]SIT13907.1 Protein of unknown function [Filimonas lacunae]
MKSNNTTPSPAYNTETTSNTTDDNWNMREMIIKFGVTQAAVLEAVKEVGKNRTRIEQYLSAKK